MKKYHIEKNTVQETLIIPLYGRKVCSDHFPQLFRDPEAERICGMLKERILIIDTVIKNVALVLS